VRDGAGGVEREEPKALTAVRLGVLGGTFDPPHLGHLLAASDAYEALALDRLLFIPAAIQPFKAQAVHATPEQRLRMLELMVAGDRRFGVDPIEIERTGLSYTVDTLEALAAREPAAQRFLLIGEDLAHQITMWRDPERIAELARIVVLTRGGTGNGWAGPHVAASASPAVPLTRLATRRIDISSSEIRARVRAGKSIHGFVTEAVAEFIRSAGLYR
jgi:nicotinate-nucleotide adenylyltransferase